jgi:hypothetical protein
MKMNESSYTPSAETKRKIAVIEEAAKIFNYGSGVTATDENALIHKALAEKLWSELHIQNFSTVSESVHTCGQHSEMVFWLEGAEAGEWYRRLDEELSLQD